MNATDNGWIARAEVVTCAAVVIWLQVVGQVTHQVLHHIIHALPVFLLLLLPKNRWVRLSSVLTGFTWVFMLTIITPMIHHAIFERGLWHDQGIFVWLAPSLAVLCVMWMTLNLTILSNASQRLPLYMAGSIVLIPLLAFLHPHVHVLFSIPVQKALEYRIPWMVVLVLELVVVLTVPWTLAVRLTRRTDLRLDRRIMIWQVLYWLFFLVCMITGLLPAVNP